MASQKSTGGVASALEPKRLRGRLRVAAIMDAAAAVFAEKGYDAATMTEIAARADTAIGSLYRFFPTKEVLADALLTRYGEQVAAALDGIAARAVGLSPAALADALVGMMLEWQAQRAAAVALVDSRGDGADRRSQLRAATVRRLSAILVAAAGPLAPDKADSMAVVLLHLLKAVPAVVQQEESRRERLLDEIRELVRLYVASAQTTTQAAGQAAVRTDP